MIDNKKESFDEFYHQKKILITGGLGMIGSSLAIKLVQLGAKVTLLDSCLKPYGANYFNIKDIKNSIEILNYDIREKDRLVKVIEDTEVIFNLAGQVSHNDSLDQPFLDTDINYIGHQNVLELVRRINPHIKILFSGSRLQYGKINENPVSEEHDMKPLTPYAVNKAATENLYLFYHRLYGVPVTIFRISNPYGPRGQMKHSKYCIINWFIRQAMENKTITIYGNGHQLRDYIYIDDLVDAFIKACANEKTNGKSFNVGVGHGIQFKEMVNQIVNIVGQGQVEYIDWPDHYINVETGNYIANINQLKNHISWDPTVDLKTGIKKTFDYYKKYIEFYIENHD